MFVGRNEKIIIHKMFMLRIHALTTLRSWLEIVYFEILAVDDAMGSALAPKRLIFGGP